MPATPRPRSPRPPSSSPPSTSSGPAGAANDDHRDPTDARHRCTSRPTRPVSPPAPRGAQALTSLISRSGAVAVLVLLLIIGAIFDKGFIHLDNLRNIALSAQLHRLITAGMTFVIISGGIDLSVGSTVRPRRAHQRVHVASTARSGPSSCRCLLRRGRPGPGRRSSRGCGCRRSSSRCAGLTGIRGLVYYITNEGNLDPRRCRATRRSRTSARASCSPSAGRCGSCLIGLRRRLVAAQPHGLRAGGRRAIGGNDTAAELMGLPVKRVKVLVYVISGLTAGLAGILHHRLVRRRPGGPDRRPVRAARPSPPSSSAAPCSAAASARWSARWPASRLWFVISQPGDAGPAVQPAGPARRQRRLPAGGRGRADRCWPDAQRRRGALTWPLDRHGSRTVRSAVPDRSCMSDVTDARSELWFLTGSQSLYGDETLRAGRRAVAGRWRAAPAARDPAADRVEAGAEDG